MDYTKASGIQSAYAFNNLKHLSTSVNNSAHTPFFPLHQSMSMLSFRFPLTLTADQGGERLGGVGRGGVGRRVTECEVGAEHPASPAVAMPALCGQISTRRPFLDSILRTDVVVSRVHTFRFLPSRAVPP